MHVSTCIETERFSRSDTPPVTAPSLATSTLWVKSVRVKDDLLLTGGNSVNHSRRRLLFVFSLLLGLAGCAASSYVTRPTPAASTPREAVLIALNLQGDLSVVDGFPARPTLWNSQLASSIVRDAEGPIVDLLADLGFPTTLGRGSARRLDPYVDQIQSIEGFGRTSHPELSPVGFDRGVRRASNFLMGPILPNFGPSALNEENIAKAIAPSAPGKVIASASIQIEHAKSYFVFERAAVFVTLRVIDEDGEELLDAMGVSDAPAGFLGMFGIGLFRGLDLKKGIELALDGIAAQAGVVRGSAGRAAAPVAPEAAAAASTDASTTTNAPTTVDAGSGGDATTDDHSASPPPTEAGGGDAGSP